MESKLKELVEANLPENRKRWALRWKEERGKVLGIVGPNVPEEIMYAAGILPWLVTGTWDAATPNASAYRPWMTSVFCSHVLESILNGDLDFLNGIVLTQQDDDLKRLWDLMNYLHKPSFAYLMYLPHVNNELTLEAFTESVSTFKKEIEKQANCVVTPEALLNAIEVYNQTRKLLHTLYDMRKKDPPSLTGAEMLGITTAAKVMPKDVFNKKVEELLPYLKTRRAPLKKTQPRVIVSSDYLDHTGYIKLIEDAGCFVAMDDLDTGSRYFWNSTEDYRKDPVAALAKRYLAVPSPRMENWEDQATQLIDWTREFKIDGIIEFRQLYSFPREFRFTYNAQRLKAAGIPHLFLRNEYHLSGEGMLKTRVEAFLELLATKKAIK